MRQRWACCGDMERVIVSRECDIACYCDVYRKRKKEHDRVHIRRTTRSMLCADYELGSGLRRVCEEIVLLAAAVNEYKM